MSNRTSLIIANRSDIHSLAVHACLELIGHKSTLCLPEYLPTGKTFSILPGTHAEELSINLDGVEIHMHDIKSVLWRQFIQDVILPTGAWSGDHLYVDRQVSYAITGLMATLNDAFMVNPSAAAFVSANKINQLSLAAKAGFMIPRTTITSDPKEVRALMNAVGRICMKPLSPHSWIDSEGKGRTALTALLSESSDISDASISLCPAIYQQYIEKKFEFRLTMFGGYHCVTRINSGDTRNGQVDWRGSREYLGKLDVTDLPERVIRAARRMLDLLGLKYGSFDLILDRSGNYIFLEVNESGAFLWQEIYCEGVSLLEPFARYLAMANDSFIWDDAASSSELSARAIIELLESREPVDDKKVRSPVARARFTTDERMSLPEPSRM